MMALAKLPEGQTSFEIACPRCGIVRSVGRHAALGALKRPRLCRKCAGSTRKRRQYQSISCRICGQIFERWSGNTKTCPSCLHKPVEPRECPVCGNRFVGYASKKTCSSACHRRLTNNDRYFGGNYFKAEGWAEKTCQVCGRHVIRGGSVHHILGHPNHDRLIYLCQGCHHLVGVLKLRPNIDLRYLILLATLQRSGHERWTVDVKIEEYDPEEWEAVTSMGLHIEVPHV